MGGPGALIYPLIFYYQAYVVIQEKEHFIQCKVLETASAAMKGDEPTDLVRTVAGINSLMICLFLFLHY